MARSVQWRRNINDVVCWRQAEAANATIYILRETGPTGFLLKEEGETKNVKVFLGDPHSCTCAQFKKDKDLCKHISWLLLKKFRIPKENPLTWQLGLVEREINEVLRGVVQQQQRRQQEKKIHRSVVQASDGREVKGQREISEDDVCPICQEELLAKHLPVTYCKFGCGNSVHIKCMKIWAEHQKGKGDNFVKCPMCREDFGPFNLLKEEMRNANGGQNHTRGVVRQDRHLGTNCQSCHTAPIEGKCYRCVVCADFMLCQSCFNSPIHTHHQFEYRQKRNQRWQRVSRRDNGVLPEAVVNNLMTRDITENDYDYLLQLDSHEEVQGSDLTEEEVNALPQERVREGGQLLAPGMQCRICLRGYEVGQLVRRLPCRHKFHKDCVDNWLLHTRSTCPVDGSLITAPLTEMTSPNNHRERRASISSAESSQSTTSNSSVLALEIPGVGIGHLPSHRTNTINRHQLRRAVRSNHVQHRAPSSLELAGTGFTLSDDRISNPSALESVQHSGLPGNHLLQRAEENRQAINNRLTSVAAGHVVNNIEFNNLPMAGNNGSLPFYNSRHPPVVPSAFSKTAESSSTRRGRPAARDPSIKHQYLKRRPSSGNRSASRERILTQALQQAHDLSVQNLYLGNNPRTNPSEQGQVPSASRGQLKTNSIVTNSVKNTNTPPTDVNIHLEGLGLENITLRDIIH